MYHWSKQRSKSSRPRIGQSSWKKKSITTHQNEKLLCLKGHHQKVKRTEEGEIFASHYLKMDLCQEYIKNS